MAKKNRNTLKGFFETGKKPSEGQYANLIDSFVTLSDENTGSLDIKGNTTLDGNLIVTNEISASGGISSSGTIEAQQFVGDGRFLTNITSSVVSTTGVTASFTSGAPTGSLIVSGNLFHPSASSNILMAIKTTGSIIPADTSNYDLGSPTNFWKSLFVSNSFATTYTGIFKGAVSGSTLSSSTQGTTVLTTNGVAGSTIDLGLQTTDSVRFLSITSSGAISASSIEVSGDESNGFKFINDSDTFIFQDGPNEISFKAGNTHTLNILSSGIAIIGNISTTGNSTLGNAISDTHLFTGHITASGNISASGTIYANNFQSAGGDVGGISFTDELNLTGNLTSSGNISSSGNITANSFIGTFVGAISSSTQIAAGISSSFVVNSATGSFILASQTSSFTLNSQSGSFLLSSQTGSLSNLIVTGSGNNRISINTSGNITASAGINASGTSSFGMLNVSQNITASGDLEIKNITASGNISSSGDLEIRNITSSGKTTLGGTTYISGSIYSGSGTHIQSAGSDGSALVALVITGSIIPEGNNKWSLGSRANFFKDLYVGRESIRFVSASGEVTPLKQENVKDIIEGKPVKQATAIAGTDVFVRTQAIFHETEDTSFIKTTVAGLWAYNGPGGNILDIDAREAAHVIDIKSTASKLNLAGTLSASLTTANHVIGGITTFGSSTVTINGPAGHITASGNISASGIITGLTGSFDNLLTSVQVDGFVSAMGIGTPTNITSNVNIPANINATQFTNNTGNLTIPAGINYTVGVGSTTSAPFLLDAAGGGAYMNGFLRINGNISSSGLIEATSASFGNLSVSAFGDISASGNISSSGGILTAPSMSIGGNSTLNFGGAQFKTDIKIFDGFEFRIGNGPSGGSTSDMALYHDGTNSYIKNNTGELRVEQRTGNTVLFNAAENGEIHLILDEALSSPVNSGRVLISGSSENGISLDVRGNITASGNISSSGTITANSIVGTLTTVNDLTLETGNSVIDSTNDAVIIANSATGFTLGQTNYPLTIASNVTASGNISASGFISSSNIHNINNISTLNLSSSGNLRVDGTGSFSSLVIDGASGLTISNGAITGSIISGSTIIATTLTGSLSGNATGLSGVPSITVNQITASATISSSGDITANNLTIANTSSLANINITGNVSSSGTISAVSMSGDGSGITGVTAEWDGSRSGNAEIIGSLTIVGGITASVGISSSTIVTTGGVTLGNGSTDRHLITGNITSSGNLSSSGTITALTGSFGSLNVSSFGNITSSGDISSSGTITSNVGTFTTLTNVNTTNITSSGTSTLGGTTYISGSIYSGSNPNTKTEEALVALVVTGSIVPEGTNKWSLGSRTNFFKDLYVSENSIRFVSASGEVTPLSQKNAKDIIEGKAPKQAVAVGGTDRFVRTQAIFHETNDSSFIKTTLAGLWGYQGPESATFNIDLRGENHILSLPQDGTFTTAGNISASKAAGAHVIGGITQFGGGAVTINGSAGHITSSGTISASGNLIAGATTVGALTATTLNTGQGANELYDMDQNVKTTSNVKFGIVRTTNNLINSGSTALGNASADIHTIIGNVTSSGNISSSGTITAATLSVATFSPTNLNTGNITGSNISASGFVSASNIHTVGNVTLLGNISGSGTTSLTIGGNTILSQITASGILSSSNSIIASQITASTFSGDGSGLTNITAEWDGTINGNAQITGSLILSGSGDTNLNVLGNITGSNISASGTVYAQNIEAASTITSVGFQNPTTISTNTTIPTEHNAVIFTTRYNESITVSAGVEYTISLGAELSMHDDITNEDNLINGTLDEGISITGSLILSGSGNSNLNIMGDITGSNISASGTVYVQDLISAAPIISPGFTNPSSISTNVIIPEGHNTVIFTTRYNPSFTISLGVEYTVSLGADATLTRVDY